MKIHPVAELFPMLPESELKELAEDIKKNGLKHPCVKKGDVLLDGRNRLRACEMVGVTPRFDEYDGDDLVEYIVSANLKRRHLNESQRAVIATEILPYFQEEARQKQIEDGKKGGRGKKKNLVANLPQGFSDDIAPKSRDRAAAIMGVSGRTVSSAAFVKRHAPHRVKDIMEGKASVHQIENEIKKEQRKQKVEELKKQFTEEKEKSIEAVCDIRACSCRELFASGIKPDVVITDPPYPKEYLDCFSELAEACKNVPLVAVMSGQSYLPEVLQRLCVHLKYLWTLCCYTPGPACHIWNVGLSTAWKPIFIFGTAKLSLGTDVVISRKPEKDAHEWGQSESVMLALVDMLSQPGQIICDPFLGGGTTALAALALGRRFIGCDINADCVRTAKALVAHQIGKKHEMPNT